MSTTKAMEECGHCGEITLSPDVANTTGCYSCGRRPNESQEAAKTRMDAEHPDLNRKNP